MGRNTLDSRTLAVPGVQLVPGQRNDGVLRCFRAAECRDEAPKVLAMANALLASPVLTLQDLSARYTSNPPRPHHFEVWFGPGPVTLSAQGTAASAAADAGKKP